MGLEEIHNTPAGGYTGTPRQVAGRGWQDPECMPLLGTPCGVPWGSQLRSRLLYSEENQQGFGKLSSNLIYTAYKIKTLRYTTLYSAQGLLEKSYQTLHI